jgi:hypothetical protein
MPRLIEIGAGAATHRPFLYSPITLKPARAPRRTRAKRRFPAVKLTSRELAEIRTIYGPFLSLERAAEIAGLAPITLKKQCSEGRYASCAKRGKPIRFLTERFVRELLGGSRE